VHDISHLSARDIRIKRGMLVSKYSRILFPERIEAIVIFPAPLFLRGMLAVFRPVMGTDFNQRMKVLAGKKAVNKFFLSKGVTNAQLLTELGGDSEFVCPREESEIVLASEIGNTKEQLCEAINKGVDAAVQELVEGAVEAGVEGPVKVGVQDVVEVPVEGPIEACVQDVVKEATQEQERIMPHNASTETAAAYVV
jgi:hypothetical protein